MARFGQDTRTWVRRAGLACALVTAVGACRGKGDDRQIDTTLSPATSSAAPGTVAGDTQLVPTGIPDSIGQVQTGAQITGAPGTGAPGNSAGSPTQGPTTPAAGTAGSGTAGAGAGSGGTGATGVTPGAAAGGSGASGAAPAGTTKRP